MKSKHSLVKVFTLLVVTFLSAKIKAQDSILRADGTFAFGKVVSIGNNAISYKKSGMEDGPTYTEDLRNIAYVRYKNGEKEVYEDLAKTATRTDVTKIDNTRISSPTQGNPAIPGTSLPEVKTPQNPMLANGPVSPQYRIEHLDKKFKVNGEKVSQNAVDKLLKKSSNPTVVAMAKTAKLTKTFQKITKISAYPSTIAGGFSSIATFSRMYEQIQDSGASFNSCKDFGLSFLGTMALPITSKILKNRRDKLYDKAIDLYNVTN